MKRIILWTVIGAVVGAIIFYPLITPVSLTIFLGMETESILANYSKFGPLFWLIPLVGLIVGGFVGRYIGKNRPSFVPFKKISLTIIFWFAIIFGILGLELGFLFSWISLIGLGNRTTAIDLWIISGATAIIGVLIGSLIGVFVALIRLAVNKFRTFNRPQTPQNL